MNDLRALLARPHALRMLVSALVGRLPEAMIPLAVLLVARHEHGSYATAGGLAAAVAAGAALGGPVAGRLIARLGQPAVLIGAAVGRSAALVALAVVAASSLAAAAPPAFLCGALTPPLEPALRVLWPDLAGGDEHALHAAYELDAGAQELIFVLAPLLVAVAVAVLSPAAALHPTAAIRAGRGRRPAPARRDRGGRRPARRAGGPGAGLARGQPRAGVVAGRGARARD